MERRRRSDLLAFCLLLAAGCEHGTSDPPAPLEHPEPTALAEDVLRLELEAQELRPLARALAGRSFGEDSVNALESHLAVTASLLLSGEGRPEGDARTAAEIGVSAAGLYYDLLRVDLEATARGMSAIPRSNCNRGVQETATIRNGMASDWRWPLTHRAEAEQALAAAQRYRDNVMEVMPLANVMKVGVAAANVNSLEISLAKLAATGLPALAALTEWLTVGGFEGASLELAGTGGGLAIRAVVGTQALVLSDAAVIALEQAGVVASNALPLLYMARGHLHHICTDKNFESDARGGPWSPRFKFFLDDARLHFDSPENLVEVEGHQGPHPEAYHRAVLKELREQTAGTTPGSEPFRAGVLRALRTLAERIKTPGSQLNGLVTGAVR
ncbi:MAG TPA: AHH domain-containing protein [Myxococcaceae bacterium]|nr:AHH domain-containing protein [Myxococcaceae bacterium]